MALSGGSVQRMPDLACSGMISAIGEVHLSNSEAAYYYVLPVEVKAKFAGRDGVFFLLFRPEWFANDFNSNSLLDGTRDGEVHFSMYRRHISTRLFNDRGERIKGARPSVLQAILGEQFKTFAAEFDALEVEPKDMEVVAAIIGRYIVGEDVLYVLQQRQDQGELMESYNITRFVEQTDEEVKALAKEAGNPKRKRGPLVITWDE
jgi:hypothetical protein